MIQNKTEMYQHKLPLIYSVISVSTESVFFNILQNKLLHLPRSCDQVPCHLELTETQFNHQTWVPSSTGGLVIYYQKIATLKAF